MKNIYITLLYILLIAYSFTLYAQNKSDKIVKAQTLMDKGEYNEANVLFDEILAANPNKLDVLYNAAYCKLFVGRADITIEYLQKFIAKNKNDAEAHNLLGIAYETIGNVKNAIEHFSTAIKLERNFYMAYFNRGRSYLKIDSIELAKKDFKFAKKDKILNPELYFATGTLYTQLQQYDSALIDLNKIIKYKSDNPYYLSILGDAYLVTAKGDKSKIYKAIEYYTKSIRLDSENVTVLSNRALLYEELEQSEKAEVDRNKILEIQKRIGINPTSIEYRRFADVNNIFSIDIPMDWNILISKNDDVDIIFFFDTNFHYEQKDGFYIYDFGGEISYYPKYFETIENNNIANLGIRENKFASFLEERKNFHKTSLNGFQEAMRKNFNPNDNMLRNLVKYTFFAKNDKKYFGLEYFCLTTMGKLIVINIWLPDENTFYYEQLLDYIYQSLEVNG